MGIESELTQYCETCMKETLHSTYEDALSIEYRCKQCNEKNEIIKNFF